VNPMSRANSPLWHEYIAAANMLSNQVQFPNGPATLLSSLLSVIWWVGGMVVLTGVTLFVTCLKASHWSTWHEATRQWSLQTKLQFCQVVLGGALAALFGASLAYFGQWLVS